jgi:hypothetical protein
VTALTAAKRGGGASWGDDGNGVLERGREHGEVDFAKRRTAPWTIRDLAGVAYARAICDSGQGETGSGIDREKGEAGIDDRATIIGAIAGAVLARVRQGESDEEGLRQLQQVPRDHH